MLHHCLLVAKGRVPNCSLVYVETYLGWTVSCKVPAQSNRISASIVVLLELSILEQ